MKKYELQNLVEFDLETNYERWLPVRPRMQSDELEGLFPFMAAGHRIIEAETGKEVMRFRKE